MNASCDPQALLAAAQAQTVPMCSQCNNKVWECMCISDHEGYADHYASLKHEPSYEEIKLEPPVLDYEPSIKVEDLPF